MVDPSCSVAPSRDTSLRYKVDDEIWARCSDGWKMGTVTALNHIEPDNTPAAYQIQLSDGRYVYSVNDTEATVTDVAPVDVMESATDPSQGLRFGEGDIVLATTAQGLDVGTIVKTGYVQNDVTHPYQIELSDGKLVYAPADDPKYVMELSVENLQASEASGQEWAESMKGYFKQAKEGFNSTIKSLSEKAKAFGLSGEASTSVKVDGQRTTAGVAAEKTPPAPTPAPASYVMVKNAGSWVPGQIEGKNVTVDGQNVPYVVRLYNDDMLHVEVDSTDYIRELTVDNIEESAMLMVDGQDSGKPTASSENTNNPINLPSNFANPPGPLTRQKGGDLALSPGQRVLATTTTGTQPGTIVACNVNEPGVGMVPYKIQLDSGGLVYAPVDDNRCVVPMMSDSVNQSCTGPGQPVSPLQSRPAGYVYGQAQTGSCPNPQTSCTTGCWVPAGYPMQCPPGQCYPPQGYPPQGQIVLINQ